MAEIFLKILTGQKILNYLKIAGICLNLFSGEKTAFISRLETYER